MTPEQAAKESVNPFDVTKNYFAEVEQLAFSPSHMVPGIEPSPDKMLQGRLFSYPDTQRHRLGPNYQQIPVNKPLNELRTYQRDGFMTVDGNMNDAPNYFPNSVGGPVESPALRYHAYQGDHSVVDKFSTADDDNFSQVGTSTRLTDNIAGSLVNASKPVQARAIANFCKADPDYGLRKAKELATEPLNPPRRTFKAVAAKQGARAHGQEFYCKRHKTHVMELTAHVVGQALPVRERVNVHGNLVRLCQVGLCKKKGRTTVDEKFVCKDHARLLREKDQFVDQSQAAFLVRRDYIRGKCASHLAMPVCNYVGCDRDKVTAKYRGFFCAGHLPVIDDLRGKIMAAKSDGDFEVQIPLRYNEIFLRKFLDKGHVHFYNSLVAKHGYVAPVVGIVGDQLVGVAGGQKTAERLLN
ncbi:hypothetical protein PHYSODRAFT_342953 [Phytophthora sojae]|uniref:Catalase core domain-containing protein n=1 Tax=Phytophthora sojae (strain P6497) TaxID=1094619 RepID=G5AI35_PHYSP|nr:hypothetical protein PHYSODRAFT_342953 [Phytophthora sojae]EGZ04760.1 hypothetical protein PHYSODRAFT_342953 [Phytophthora sojae]|eukprot:XP_009539736.1 hypothetical protein PHYSODRAFT_342953 [Phytophthora sojae]